MKRLYNMYLDKPWYNKVLDKLVLLASIIIISSVVVHFLVIKLHPWVMWVLNIPSAMILFVFVLEVVRFYMQAKDSKEFLRKHWIDFVLIAFLSFYFFVMGAINILKALKVIELVPLAKDAKDARIFYNLFKK